MKTSHERLLYWGTVGLVGYNLFTYGRWSLLEVMVRTGTWPSDLFSFDAYGYAASMSLLQEVIFFMATGAVLVAFVLLLRRSKWSPLAYGAYFIASLLDWLLMVGNPFIGMGMNGYFGIIVNLTALSSVILLSVLGLLKGRPKA